MTPFNESELAAAAQIRALIEQFKADLHAANPKASIAIEVRSAENIVVQTRNVETRLTTHTNALEHELDRIFRIYDNWIAEPEQAGLIAYSARAAQDPAASPAD